jgi:hypothetical protein
MIRKPDIFSSSRLFIFAWALWLSLPYWIFGSSSYIRVHDNAESLLTLTILQADQLMSYGSNYWLPSLASGTDAFSNSLTSPFRGIFSLFLFFPHWLGYALIMFLQVFGASYFSYLICRRFLGFSKCAAVTAGMFWSMGYWSLNDWTLFDKFGPPFIPLYLYLLEIALTKKGWQRLLIAGLAGLFVSVGSYFPLFTPFFIAGAVIWFIFIRGYAITSLIPTFFVFCICTLPLAVQQLIAIYTHYPLSGRALVGLEPMGISTALTISAKSLVQFFTDFLWIPIFSGLALSRFTNQITLKLTLTAAAIYFASTALWIISKIFSSFLLVSAINPGMFTIICPFFIALSAASVIDIIKDKGIYLWFSRARS